jgi:hypothetical protein
MYRIRLESEDETRTVKEAETLDQIITEAFNSRSFIFSEDQRLVLEKVYEGGKNEIDVFSPGSPAYYLLLFIFPYSHHRDIRGSENLFSRAS